MTSFKQSNRRTVVDGANGYVGANFISALEKTGRSDGLSCLVRGGGERLARAMATNVVVESCDDSVRTSYDYSLTDADLGLGADLLEELFAVPCDYWHIAAEIDLSSGSSQSLVRTNVEGTRNSVATFARHAKPGSRYFYLGTAYSGGISKHAVTEEWHPQAPQAAFRTLYEWTKREAELLVKPLTDDPRFDVSILRLGQIVGHSKTGAYRTSAGMYEILSAVNRLARTRQNSVMRVVADTSATLSLLPVDVCVDWMLAVADAPSLCDPAIYHLVDSSPVDVPRFFESVSRHAGLEVRAVDRELFVEPNFIERAIDSRLSFAGRYIREPIEFERKNLTRLLADDRPVVTDEVLDRLVGAAFNPSNKSVEVDSRSP